jgi:hypothetical protein
MVKKLKKLKRKKYALSDFFYARIFTLRISFKIIFQNKVKNKKYYILDKYKVLFQLFIKYFKKILI